MASKKATRWGVVFRMEVPEQSIALRVMDLEAEQKPTTAWAVDHIRHCIEGRVFEVVEVSGKDQEYLNSINLVENRKKLFASCVKNTIRAAHQGLAEVELTIDVFPTDDEG